MTNTNELLADISRSWRIQCNDGDMPRATQLCITFDEAGGFAGWDNNGKRRWVMPSGRRTTSRVRALRAWANLSK